MKMPEITTMKNLKQKFLLLSRWYLFYILTLLEMETSKKGNKILNGNN